MSDKKVLIFYNSKRGSTKDYADWIADGVKEEASNAGINLTLDRVSMEECDFDDFETYDAIVFGSWLRGSGIVGLDVVKPYMDGIQKKCIIYCCGISDYNPGNYAQIVDINFNDKIDMSAVKLYYCPGAYDPSKVKGIDKLMMWIAKRVVMKGSIKEEASQAYRMKKIIEEGADLKDMKYAKQVIQGVMKIISE